MPKILIIDDNKDYLDTVSSLLEINRPDFKVMTAQSGSAGIRMAQTELPDTILLDIKMPKMDGYELCQRLKQKTKTKRIPIIFLTAVNSDAQERKKGLALGGDAYLTKPVETVELIAQIDLMLRIKKVEDQLRKERDLLERKVQERTTALSDSEQRFKEIFQGIKDIIVYVDKYGKIIEVNDQIEEILGYSRDDILGRHFSKLDFLKLKDLPQLVHLFKEALKQGEIISPLGKGSNTLEIELRNREGRKVLLETITTEVRENGKIAGFTSILRDITERKKAEEALQKAAQQWQTTFNGIVDAICVIDTEMKVTQCNKAMSDFLGKDPEDIIGHTCYKLVHESEEPLENCPLVRMKESNRTENQVLHVKDQHLEVHTHPLFDENKVLTGAVHIISDITESKQTEQKLQEYRKHLEEMVDKRTSEMQKVVNLMAGREVRMAELKKTVKKLRLQLESAGLTPVVDDPLKTEGMRTGK